MNDEPIPGTRNSEPVEIPPTLDSPPADSPHTRVVADSTPLPTLTRQGVGPGAIVASPTGGPVCCPEDYEILGKLGQGGMGVVYKARQKSLNRLVALKMILDRHGITDAQVAQFRREAEALARLQHPNVVQIYEIGEVEGTPYFAMEFVPGGSLDRMIASTPQPARESAQLVRALADAMSAAHLRDVIHRDLKPANVLMMASGGSNAPGSDEAGSSRAGSSRAGSSRAGSSRAGSLLTPLAGVIPKITDFGLAKRLDDDSANTRTGAVMGTPSYMAPEQAAGLVHEIGPWTDIYALGAILYEMLTGRPPFKAASVLDTLAQVRDQDPVPPRRLQPKCPRDLETICLKCLRKAPQARYATGQLLADDLRRWLDGLPIVARPVGRIEKTVKWAKRRPAQAALVLGVFLVLLLAGLAYAKVAVDRRKQEAEYTRQLEQKYDEAAAEVTRLEREKREENERIRLAVLSNKVDGLMESARIAAKTQTWKKAEQDVQEAILYTRTEPKLETAHAKALALQAMIEKAGRRAETFTRERDAAMYDLLLIIGRDRSIDRRKAVAAAGKALAVVGITEQNEDRIEVEELLDDDAKKDYVERCHELLLVQAVAEATPMEGDAPTKQQLESALAVLDRAGKLGRKTKAHHVRRAQILERLKDPRHEDEQKLADNLQPETALDYFLEGERLMREGDLDESVQHFDIALRVKPGHFWARYVLSICHSRRKNWDAARTGLTSCIADRSDFVQAYIDRGTASSARNDLKAALKDYEKADEILRAAPNERASFILHLSRGNAYGFALKLKDAKEEFEKASAIRPKDHRPHSNWARLVEKQGRPKEALPAYDRAIELEPKLIELHRARARLNVLLKDPDSALRDFNEAIAMAGDNPRGRDAAEDLVARALVLRSMGKPADALKDCSRALNADPLLAMTHRLMGEIHYAAKQYNDAALHFRLFLQSNDASARSPDVRAPAYRMRGYALEKMKRFDEALTEYNRSLDLKGESETYLLRAWLLVQLDALRLAQMDFATVTRTEPRNPHALAGTSFIQVMRGDYRNGTAGVKKAVEQSPESVPLAYIGARCHAQAVALVRLDAKLMPAEKANLAGQYEEQAVAYITGALNRMPEKDRATFVKSTVIPDAAMNPIRNGTPFLKLVRDYSDIKPGT